MASELLQTHGYWLLALGCLLEGETVLVLAGFAAHRGWLDPKAVLAIAATAGFFGDQLFFWLGRRHGAAVLARWPRLAERSAQVQRLVERWHEAFIVGVRFAYGLRIAGPVLIGTSRVSATRFAAFNAVGAVLWAFVVASVGWFFGAAAERVLGGLHQVEGALLLALLGALGLFAAWRHWRHSRARRADAQSRPRGAAGER